MKEGAAERVCMFSFLLCWPTFLCRYLCHLRCTGSGSFVINEKKCCKSYYSAPLCSFSFFNGLFFFTQSVVCLCVFRKSKKLILILALS